MNRSNSNNHNDQSSHHQHQFQIQNETTLNMNQNNNNNSFQDYLQSSAHNLSFTNLHQNSFEMEDTHHHPPHNLPLSPVHRSSNYIPQSFLSKPFEENYDAVEQKSSQWKFNWTNQNNQQSIGNNNVNTPNSRMQNLNDSSQLQQQHQQQNQQKGDCLWDSSFLNENNNNNRANALLNTDLDITSSQQLINNFSAVLNDNGIFSDIKGTPINRSSRSNHNPHQRKNSLHDNHFGMDMEDEFPNPSRYNNNNNNNQMDIEGSGVFDQSGTPTLYKKGDHNIVMNYDNYQQSIKTDARTSYDPLGNTLSAAINSNHTKSFNYLFNSVNDHLPNDFKFSPIKPSKHIPFSTPSYFADKAPFSNYAAPTDELSPKIQSTSTVLPSSSSAAPPQFSSINNNNNNNSGSNSNISNNNQNNSTSNGQTTSQACVCNCKKTKCLKLYCECFAKLGYCGEGCHCHECKNRPDNEEERQNAIQEAKLRNQDAFQPKVVNECEQAENKRKSANEQLKKGCNCRKTKCLKKYCECFNAGAYCNTMCKCDSCENHPRNAALILSKKNASSGQMPSQIIQHHAIDIRPPSLVVSNYNQGGYYQNTYGYPSTASLHLHNQPHQNHLSTSNLLHHNTSDISNPLSHNNPMSAHFIDSSSLYKTNAYQGRLLFEDNNDDSDPTNPSNKGKQDRKYIINKLRKQKKQIIKNRREALENSDEEADMPSSQGSSMQQLQQQLQSQQQSQSSSSQQVKLRTKRRSENSDESSNLKNDLSMSDEDMHQQQKIIDMEKKLKQIQQVQLILQQQQILKQKQHKLLNYNNSEQSAQQQPSKSLTNIPQQLKDNEEEEEVVEQEQAQLQQYQQVQVKKDQQQTESQQQRFISPPSNSSQNEMRNEDIDEEDIDQKENETLKAHQILNGIKKNKKKSLKKKDSTLQQLSEEKKQKVSSSVINNDLNPSNKKYIPYDEDQENSVSYSSQFSQATTLTQQQQQQQQQQHQIQKHSQFRNRLNSENYEYIRQKSIQNSTQFSLLSNNPSKYSTNLFNPTTYVRQEDPPSQCNEIFPYQSQRIKKNSAHYIKAP